MWFGLKKIVVTAPFVMAIAASANADDKYDKCMSGAMTNRDFGEFGGAFIDREDAKLNATWKKLYGGAVPEQTKKDLLAEQRLWIAFRESACQFYANGDWGREGQVIGAPACIARVIARRTKELEGYLNDISGQ